MACQIKVRDKASFSRHGQARSFTRSGLAVTIQPESGGVVFSKLSKLLNQEHALGVPCLQHFRNDCGAIKVARFGFPGEKTAKEPVACSSVVPTTSAGNPVSVCSDCETP
jgi:hypothetical protein